MAADEMTREEKSMSFRVEFIVVDFGERDRFMMCMI
jgi:hypothetical protein